MGDDVDADGSGVIDYTEFLAASMEKKIYLQEECLWGAFRLFDKDNNGEISKEELKQMLSTYFNEEEKEKVVLEILANVDTGENGTIDFNEFVAMMHKGGLDNCA